jgi:hypothetical protein
MILSFITQIFHLEVELGEALLIYMISFNIMQIFHLEGELGEAQKAAGLPVQLPPKEQTHSIEATVVPSVSLAVKSAPKTHGNCNFFSRKSDFVRLKLYFIHLI